MIITLIGANFSASNIGTLYTTSPVWYVNYLDQVAASGKDIAGGTAFTGSSIAPVAFSDSTNAKLVGKTIDTVEIVPERAGTLHFGTYNATTYVYTSKALIEIAEADINKRTIYTFTPFTVSSGEYFTFFETSDKCHASYYLASDLTGVDYDDGLKTKCNGAAPTMFNYQLTTLINIGSSTGNGGNSAPSTPTNAEWYINSLTQAEDAGTDILSVGTMLEASGDYAWAFQDAFNSKLQGKTINTIRLFPYSEGNFSVGVFDPSTNTVTEKRNITISSSDINTVKTYTFDNLTIPSGKYFTWNCDYVGKQAQGYYVLKDKLDPLAVETCGWYTAKSTGLFAFGEYQLIFCADIGYTP